MGWRSGRGGRPKKEGDRHPGGRLVSGIDRGTPELQEKRQAIVGKKGDPNMSTSLTDVLLDKGLINDDENKFLALYRRWHRRTIALNPNPKVANYDGEMSGGNPVSDENQEKDEANYRTAEAILLGLHRDGNLSRRVLLEFNALVFQNQMPMLTLRGNASELLFKKDEHGRRNTNCLFYQALDALMSWHRRPKKAA